MDFMYTLCLLACHIPMEPINLCLIKDVFIVVSIQTCLFYAAKTMKVIAKIQQVLR